MLDSFDKFEKLVSMIVLEFFRKNRVDKECENGDLKVPICPRRAAASTYTRLDQKYSGVTGAGANAAVGKPVAAYELKDQDTYQLLLRAQRNW